MNPMVRTIELVIFFLLLYLRFINTGPQVSKRWRRNGHHLATQRCPDPIGTRTIKNHKNLQPLGQETDADLGLSLASNLRVMNRIWSDRHNNVTDQCIREEQPYNKKR
jgi:hypothetical protein